MERRLSQGWGGSGVRGEGGTSMSSGCGAILDRKAGSLGKEV